MKKVDTDYEWYGIDCASEPSGKPMTLDEYAQHEVELAECQKYAEGYDNGYDCGYDCGYEAGTDAGYEEAINEVDSDHLLLDRDTLERLGRMLDITRSAIRKTVDMSEDTDETSTYRKDLYDLHHEIYSLAESLVMDQVCAFWRAMRDE